MAERFKARGAVAQAAPRCEPNITPLIDIVLVLLIVFMVMVPGLGHALMVKLPERGGGGKGLAPLRLELSESGALSLDGQGLREEAVPAAVDAALRDRLGSDRRAVVAVHPSHPFKRAAELLSAVKGRHPDVTVALVTAKAM
ncbi:MAG TPA: biopolymer transporter ExbD [Holophagaceae bacterium]|nr:biopolymer transporter ExbD [Holophagaceae bacterium]